MRLIRCSTVARRDQYASLAVFENGSICHILFVTCRHCVPPSLVKRLFLDYQTVNMLYLQNFPQLWGVVFISDLMKVIQVKVMFGKYSLRNFNQELFLEGTFCHYECIFYIKLKLSSTLDELFCLLSCMPNGNHCLAFMRSL